MNVKFERLHNDPHKGRVIVDGIAVGPISPATDGEALAIWVEAAIRQGDIEVTR